MADVYDANKRSEVMSRIRSKNTKAELIVFRYLRQSKVYFQKHYSKVPGKPDVALPRKKKAVFIDSDFWHGRTYEKVVANRPEDDYWVIKIRKNMERDKVQRADLLRAGWGILVIWEEDLKRKSSSQATLERIKEFLLA